MAAVNRMARIIAIVVTMSLCSTLCAQETPGAAFVINIPKEIPPASVIIMCGLYGDGLHMSTIRGREGLHNYSIDLNGVTYVKLLAYSPGYCIATKEVATEEARASEQWLLHFDNLPTVALRGVLVDSKGNPMPGEKLSVSYSLVEAMEFFGYIDGSVPDLPVATAVTDNDGAFVLHLPSLLSDPFFIDYKGGRRFSLSLIRKGIRHPTWELVPSSIPAKKFYPKTVTVTMINHARLMGHIREQFLKQNEIVGEIAPMLWLDDDTSYRVDLWARAKTTKSKRSYNCLLRKDRTFFRTLPPGTYDVYLRMMKRGGILHKEILLAGDLILEEDEDEVITVR